VTLNINRIQSIIIGEASDGVVDYCWSKKKVTQVFIAMLYIYLQKLQFSSNFSYNKLTFVGHEKFIYEKDKNL
jgi:hypothetical protein